MDNTLSLLAPSTSLRGFQEGSDDVGRAIHDSSDWLNFFQLGTIVQGRTKLLICKRRKEQSPLYMFKHLEDTQEAIGRRLLGMEHPSIVQARCIVQDISGQQIGYDYVKFTLQEVLSTHLPLQESHLRLIATSVFSAIKFLASEGLQHQKVSPLSIRLCGRTGKVFLGDCEESTPHDGPPNNIDLEALGLTMLCCMEPRSKQANSAEEVRQRRATNQVFTLQNGEKWSGCKQLIDFLDDLFCTQRLPAVKLRRPHDYVEDDIPSASYSSLLPYVELVSLECFTLWHAA